MRTSFNVPAVYVHNAGCRAEKCAGDRDGFAFSDRGKLKQIGIVSRSAETRLGDFQSQTFCEGRRVDFIDLVPAGALKKSFQDGARNRSGIHLVDLAAVIDIQALDAFRGELPEESRELFAKTQMGTDDRERFGVEVWHVHGIADRSFEERGANRLSDLDADAFLGFGRRGAEGRGQNQV